MRNPELLAILAAHQPACPAIEVEWSRPLRITAFVCDDPVPDELVTSVRVVVRVGDGVVVCTNRDGGSHLWPGGHREAGETYAETACREVLEETGWVLDPASIEPAGFMLLENLGEPNPPYPHPDSVHLVVTALATERVAEEWTDVEGWEVASQVVSLDGFDVEVEANCVPFLEVLRARSRRGAP